MTVDPGPRAADVLRFWRRAAPKFGLPAPEETLAAEYYASPRTLAYLVTVDDLRAVVRWPRGSLLRYDQAARDAARLFIAAAEAGLAPRVLLWEQGALELDGQPVVVSEYIAGPPLPPDWFRDNVRQAATLLARLHRDEALTDLLEHMGRGDPRGDCLAAARAAWADVQARYAALRPRDWSPAVRGVLDELAGYIPWFGTQIQPHLGAFRGHRVGPVHGDLNDSNWLADDDNRVYLVDWEQARLDDPALDVGMVLHWYVPPVLWPLFVREYVTGGSIRLDADALLIRARIRYPLHIINLCLWRLEQMAESSGDDEADALAFMGVFLADLRRLRAGTFGVES